MSKLEVIILEYGNAVLDLPKTNDPIGKPIDEARSSIKQLIKSLWNEADNESDSIEQGIKLFQKKVEKL